MHNPVATVSIPSLSGISVTRSIVDSAVHLDFRDIEGLKAVKAQVDAALAEVSNRVHLRTQFVVQQHRYDTWVDLAGYPTYEEADAAIARCIARGDLPSALYKIEKRTQGLRHG